MNNTRVHRCTAAAAALIAALSFAGTLAPSASAEISSDYSITVKDKSKKKTGWVKKGSKTYLYDKNGKMCTGWKKVNGKRYYFGKDGVMRTGWATIGGKTYCFSKDGYALTGTVKIDGKTYTFDSNGVLKNETDSKKSNSKIKFGMSFEETQKILESKYPAVTHVGDKILSAASSSDDYSFYVFDDDGKMQIYGEGSKKDKLSKYDENLTKLGFVKAAEDSGIAIYATKNQMAFLVPGGENGYKSIYFVLSQDITSQFKNGQASFEELESLMSAFG